jgi:hypothetical protein
MLENRSESQSPSHYAFLLIIEVMASSPLLQPADNIGGLIL